jgi:CxxC-x17-CxxC domain-containing protein
MNLALEFVDRSLKCVACGTDFVFTINEQQFFAQKGLANRPKRCIDCRVLLRAHRNGEMANTTVVQCTECGVNCRVPFVPRGHKAILCLTCMHTQKQSGNPA